MNSSVLYNDNTSIELWGEVERENITAKTRCQKLFFSLTEIKSYGKIYFKNEKHFEYMLDFFSNLRNVLYIYTIIINDSMYLFPENCILYIFQL